MMSETWVIVGATSSIAKAFAHLAAEKGHSLMLIGRDEEELATQAADLQLRYSITCGVLLWDMSKRNKNVLSYLKKQSAPFALFIAPSLIVENNALDIDTIKDLIQVNIIAIAELIHTYLQTAQAAHRLIFLSSVASCRGRAKNSLYGASKAAINVYLEGLQQQAGPLTHLLIVKLGFIDTNQTYGQDGIFYASSPQATALACWKASYANKHLLYHPFFWRYIMTIMRSLPFFMYKRLKDH